MWQKVLLIVTCMLISDWANVLLKVGATKDSFFPSPNKIIGILGNPWMMGGFFLYGTGMLLWLTVLANNRFSTAMAIFSLHYIHLMLLGWLVFKEPIQWNMWLGTALIVLGVASFTAPQWLAAAKT